MDQPLFQYFQFIELDNIIYGRPANPFKQKLFINGCYQVANPDYFEFEAFAIEMTFQAFGDKIKPGLYDRGDIKIIEGANNRYYALTTIKKPQHHESES